MKIYIKSLVLVLLMILTTSNMLSQANMSTQNTKKISITIDDLPFNIAQRISNSEMKFRIEKLLGQIKTIGAPVVGFVNEVKLEVSNRRDQERVEILNLWLEAGVELGNHTYSHKGGNSVPLDEYKTDIVKGERTLLELLKARNETLRYFRHPFLHTGLTLEYKHSVENFLSERGYIIAPVTIDNSEWIFASAYDKKFVAGDSAAMKKIGEEYINYMREKLLYFEDQTNKLLGRQINQILLIHANRLNADYYVELCEMIKNENYSFIALEEALKDEAYKSEDTFIKNNGISWLHRWAYSQGKRKEFFGNEPETPKYILEIAGLEYE